MKIAKKLAAFTLVVGLSLLAGAAQAQELWNGAALGMSPREVLQVFPTARATSDPENKAAFGTLLVTMQEVNVFGHRGWAEFYFEKDKLNTVRLWVEPQDLTEQSNQVVLQRMQAAFAQPPECVFFACVWRLPTRTIALSTGGLKPPSRLMVEYTGASPRRKL